MKLLSICLPTYNRSSLVINQLEFLKNETSEYSDLIDIYVSDNNSDEEHQLKLKEYHQTNSFFNLIQQSKNHGLIGNIYQLLRNLNSKYVWFVGDDDVLLVNIIKRLVKILNIDSKLGYVFFNHQGFIGEPTNIVSNFNLLGYSGKINSGKQCLIELFNKNFTSLMFITACVYNVEILKSNFLNNNRQINIEDPLLFSFVCANNEYIHIEEEVFVLDRYANATWKDTSSKIFGWGVPLSLIELKNYQYEKGVIKSLLFNYYKYFAGSYARMLIFSPFKTRFKIITFLGVLNLVLLIKSIKFVISRLFLKLSKKSSY